MTPSRTNLNPPPLHPPRSAWIVHKFGGTSVANAERYRGVGEIMGETASQHTAIVVSAMSGVTNTLIDLAGLAAQRDNHYRGRLAALGEWHVKTAVELLGEELALPLIKIFEND